jgi:hypothetical protein
MLHFYQAGHKFIVLLSNFHETINFEMLRNIRNGSGGQELSVTKA